MALLPDSFQHIGKREQQQDAFWFSNLSNQENGALVVVADGMGGMAMGQESAQLCVNTLSQTFNEKNVQNPVQWLNNSTQLANQKVYEMANQAGVAGEAGCTLVCTYIENNLMYWLSVGDSHIFVVREGEIAQINTAHTYGNYLWREVQAGRLSKQEAETHPDRNALTSFVGIPRLSEIDQNFAPLPLHNGDLILLCTDGLTNTLNHTEIAHIIRQNPLKPTQALVDAVLAKNLPHQDNVTIATLAYTKTKPESPPPLPTPPTEKEVHKIHQKNTGWIKIGLFAFAGLLGFFLIWKFLFNSTPATEVQPNGMVYIGNRQWSDTESMDIQPIRGYFLNKDELLEGEMRWTNAAGTKDTLASVRLNNQITPLGQNAMHLQGIVRSDETQLDQLLFSSKKNPSIYYLFTWNDAQKMFVADSIKGSFLHFKETGLFYLPNEKSDIPFQKYYPMTSFRKPNTFLPLHARRAAFIKQEASWQVWLNKFGLPSDTLRQQLGVKVYAAHQFTPLAEEAILLRKELPQDQRFSLTAFNFSANEKLNLYHFLNQPEGWTLASYHKKDSVYVFNPLVHKGLFNTCQAPTLTPLKDTPDIRFVSKSICGGHATEIGLNISTKKWKRF